MRSSVPEVRIRLAKEAPVREDGGYVLYWMSAARRAKYNFGLQRAVDWAVHLDRPLLVIEALRAGYRWACPRFHAFVIDGMADNEAAFRGSGASYRAYVEPRDGAGKGLLAALAREASVVVADDWPCFFLPRALAALATSCPVRLEAVDGNGLYPMYATDRVFTTAHSFRAHLQKQLPAALEHLPREDPLAGVELKRLAAFPDEVKANWDFVHPHRGLLDEIELAGTVPATEESGGAEAGRACLRLFVETRLGAYGQDRNSPDADGASGLSPYLHFGHVGAHEVFAAVVDHQDWDPSRLGDETRGSRAGFWGMEAGAEAFLDELVTWRELGLNRCALTDDYDRFESLPGWARATLRDHLDDEREYVYDLETFARAETHDALWNAAQRQLLTEGRMHNYLRMLWGKKILEWTEHPKQALEIMLELNNRYALDGRDPNSYSGVFWVLGRYDRAWGPERPIFGKVRFMSSQNTRKKLSVDGYLERYGEGAAGPSQGVLFE